MPRVPDTTRRDFLVEVAKLYYEQDLSQAEIAGRFDISRSLVSHLLKLSRQQGIVEIRINDTRSRTVAAAATAVLALRAGIRRCRAVHLGRRADHGPGRADPPRPSWSHSSSTP